MHTLLDIHDLSYTYQTPEGETPALSHISLTVDKGEFIAVVGPSGCGKSTLLSLISGLLSPSDGTITFHGQSMGYMLQKDHLFEWCSIYKNITLGLDIKHRLNDTSKQAVSEMMDTYGLGSFAKVKPSQLSGGMRQRAALIRTLALEPELLLLDEPFSALDYQTRLNVCDDIYHIIMQEHKTAILVTHDLAEAISVGDRVIVLSKRPASIRKNLPISFQMENRTPFASRNEPNFKDYFNEIWEELNV